MRPCSNGLDIGPAARGVTNSLASNAPDWCDKATHANLVESPFMTA